MSITATDGAGSIPPIAFGREAPGRYSWFKRSRRLLRRTLRTLAVDTGMAGADVPTIAPRVTRELAAIRSYALFLAKYPDMPAEHRERFLAEIDRCCGEAMDELS